MPRKVSQSIPTIQTERLRLRPLFFGDFHDYANLLASPRAKFMGGPYTRRAAWGVFCHDIACWDLFGHGGLMIELRATGECVGQVSISHGALYPEKELGWQLYEGYEGKGYATEAAAALRQWAAHSLGLHGLVSYMDPENHKSAAVAKRLGGVLDPDAPKQDADDLVFRYPSSLTINGPR